EDGIRDDLVTGVQTCALPICFVFWQPGTDLVANGESSSIPSAVSEVLNSTTQFMGSFTSSPVTTIDAQPSGVAQLSGRGVVVDRSEERRVGIEGSDGR